VVRSRSRRRVVRRTLHSRSPRLRSLMRPAALRPRQVLKVSAVMLRSLHSMLQTMELLPVRIALTVAHIHPLDTTRLTLD